MVLAEAECLSIGVAYSSLGIVINETLHKHPVRHYIGENDIRFCNVKCEVKLSLIRLC